MADGCNDSSDHLAISTIQSLQTSIVPKLTKVQNALKKGVTRPETTAPNIVCVNDWQDATVPLIFGNKFMTSRASVGAISDMPNV